MKIFDAHFHIINPNYPLIASHGYLPPKFTIEDYRERTKSMELLGGAVVSGSFQAFDQEYLIDTLNGLGDNFCGIANIPFDMPDAELDRLNQAGVVAVRFNLKRGGSEQVGHLEYLSTKLHGQYGWHTEFYMDSKDIHGLFPTLRRLPAFSIDHLGLNKIGLSELYKCVELGARIKATGFGRLNFDPVLAMKEIYKINPEALLFGTDLPSTRAKVPFSVQEIDLISEHFSIDEQERIFFKNAQIWYKK